MLNGGRITNPGTGTNPDFIFKAEARAVSSEDLAILINDVQTANLETSSGFMASADDGSIVFKNRMFDGLDTSPNLMGPQFNVLADGGFEETTVIDTVVPLEGSTNITIVTGVTNPRTGSRSLEATHTGNPCKLVIAVPIHLSQTFKYEFFAAVTAGTVSGIVSKYVLGEVNAAGNFDVKRSQTAVSHGSFSATSYTLIASNNQNHRAPSWATHAIIEFNMDTFGGNTLFIDDIIVNNY
jgi:hypothetical protein